MLAGNHQGHGYGRAAITCLVNHLRALGIPRLYASYDPGEEGPGKFYEQLRFVRTGDSYVDELEVVFELQ